MANGKVEDLSWSQLRPRRSIPQCVLDSIPPEDLQAFLKLIATNPFLPFVEASAVRRKIVSVRQWRAETANPNTITTEFSLIRTTNKRKRSTRAVPEKDVVPSEQSVTDSEGDQPKRKQRRSTRPGSSDGQDELDSPPPEREPPKIGEEYQAEVPTAPLIKEERMKYQIVISSQLVYSEQRCGGSAAVNMLLRDLNKDVRLRDGYEMAPFALEVALQLLFSIKQKGAPFSRLQILQRIPRGPYFPGIKGHFKYEEQCLFVRTLGERSKNFRLMSREVLPHRTTSELVWLYYTRHKQLWMQNGGMKDGQIVDDGGEKLKRVQLTATRTITALRSLAITAGDGFPVDSRVNLAAMAYRRGMLAERRKQRDEENLSRGTRLRSQNH